MRRLFVMVDSHGGVLISVTEPCPGGLDTRNPVRVTLSVTGWQDRWLGDTQDPVRVTECQDL